MGDSIDRAIYIMYIAGQSLNYPRSLNIVKHLMCHNLDVGIGYIHNQCTLDKIYLS